MKNTTWQEQQNSIKAKIVSSFNVKLQTISQWKKVATETLVAFKTAFVKGLTQALRKRRENMYTLLHHWYRKHPNMVENQSQNPRLPGTTFAGSRD